MWSSDRTASATHIPSCVVRLPRPCLPPCRSGDVHWQTVQASPDRGGVLLRGSRECQLLALPPRSPSDLVSNDAAADAAGFSSSSTLTPGDAHRYAGDDGHVVLPQPHRRLTSSCWMSPGMAGCGRHGDGGAVVVLGDAAATVTVTRHLPSPPTDAGAPRHGGNRRIRRATPTTAETAWVQATVFLEDDTDDIFARRAGRRLDNDDAMGRPCLAAAGRAVETVLSCSYTSATTWSSSGGLVDAYLICQRGNSLYDGSGIAAAGHASKRETSNLWMVSVPRESAWRVPLVRPAGEGEDEDEVMDSGINLARVPPTAQRPTEYRVAAALTWKYPPLSTTRPLHQHRQRLFDVHRRAPLPQAYRQAGPIEHGPVGHVFAIGFRRHVGLYAATTVTPTVFFRLPPWLVDGRPQSLRGEVTSVVEAPPSPLPTAFAPVSATATATAALGFDVIGGGGCTYLVTVACTSSHPPRYRGCGDGVVKSEPIREAHEAEAVAAPPYPFPDTGSSCWCLLYDCRNPSTPVWAAAMAVSEASSLFTEPWEEGVKVVPEWLTPRPPASLPSQSAAPHGVRSQRGGGLDVPHPICVTCVSQPRREGGSAGGGNVCVVLDGGTHIRDGEHGRLGNNGRTASTPPSVRRAEEVAAPIMHELVPPLPHSSPECKVRALVYGDDGILRYLCDAISWPPKEGEGAG